VTSTRRVLLTGATGFIGRHAMAPLLERGFEIHAVSPGEPPASPAVRWHRANLLDPDSVPRLVSAAAPTHLLHFAWAVVPGGFAPAADHVRWVEATLRLVRAFQDAGGARVVIAGSCAEYAWGQGYCSEATTPIAPRTPYGACKHAAHVAVRALAEATRLSSAWGRIFFVYGPHEKPPRLVPSVLESLGAGEPVRCSHGEQRRDYMYVEDVAQAFAALLDSDVQGAVNVASGAAIRVGDLVRQLVALIDPAAAIRFGAVETPPDDPPLVAADVSRLREEVGWHPRVDLEDGLRQTVNWWRTRKSAAVPARVAPEAAPCRS
jgi:nucleoside-diphosphate-sugar epimerase